MLRINNQKEPPPSRIYKFYRINDNLISTLRDNYIWLSSPDDFNDPFDCYKNLLTYDVDNISGKELFNELNKSRRERRERRREHLKNPNFLSKQFENIIEEEIKKFGVGCFCKEYKNILMWSHYADCHKGLCLCFDVEIDAQTFLVGKVQYIDKFLPINFFSNDSIKVIEKLCLTKSKQWEYEKEYRLFEEYSGKKYFPKEALIEVIFGCKTNEEDKRQVLDIIKSNYPNVKIRQAKMKEREFVLSFQEIKYNLI